MTSPIGHGLLWGAALLLVIDAAFILARWAVEPATALVGGYAIVAGVVGLMVVHA